MAVVFLHHRPELLERAAILLNSEWPRSLEARKHSIENSCDGLPLSLLMMDDGECNVIGFVRVLSVANREGGALIESLLIDSNMRRRGLGRKLMSQAENYVLKLGYKTVHLSTHDQHRFYQSIGYIEGRPVDGTRKCNAIVDKLLASITPADDDDHDHDHDHVITTGKEESSQHGPLTTIQDTPPSIVAPPPPPPPPAINVKVDNNNIMKWYIKYLT